MTWLLQYPITFGVWAAFTAVDTVAAADRLGCRASVYRVPRDLVLDSLFGPVEDFEYARTVAPTT